MSYDDHYPDPAERDVLSAEDELLADLIAEYIARREAGVTVVFPELQARAAELGDRAAGTFEDLVVYWELKRLEGEA